MPSDMLPGLRPAGPAHSSAQHAGPATTSDPAAAGPDKDVDAPYRAELLDLADGDAGLARTLEASLHRLASGHAGPLLAELADDVLHSRARLRTAASSTVYGAALGAAVHQFQRWYDRLDAQQRAALTDGADLACTSEPGPSPR